MTSAHAQPTLPGWPARSPVASLGSDDVVKVSVFLRDLDDYAARNAVHAEYFAATKPVRPAVQVARLPRDVGVEIESVAHAGR